LGLFGLQYAKLLLNARIIAIDVMDEKINVAYKIMKFENTDILLNASKVDVAEEIKKITRGKGVRAVIDFVGSRRTLETYMKTLGKRSHYVIVGLHSSIGPKIPILSMIISEISLLGSLWGNIRELYEVTELARRNLVIYRELVEKIKLSDINRAFERLEKGKVVGRQMVTFKKSI